MKFQLFARGLAIVCNWMESNKTAYNQLSTKILQVSALFVNIHFFSVLYQ